MSPHNVVLLGEVEQVVLMAVLRLGEDAYAVPMRELIETETGVSLSRGSMYVTLERLEQKGYLGSWFSDPQAVRGGKARRYYRLKPAGLKALERSQQAIAQLAKGTVLAPGRKS